MLNNSQIKISALGLVSATTALVANTACPASAITLTWTLERVQFEDGGSAEGSFDYNADTNIYSNVWIRTDAGSQGFSNFYDSDTSPSFGGDATSFSIYDQFFETALYLRFDEPLTNSGGNINLQGNEATALFRVDSRSITSGQVTALPFEFQPSIGLLALGALSSILYWRRRMSN